MKELKGIISWPFRYGTERDTVSFTCCSSQPLIKVGEVNLHEWLTELFGIKGDDAEECFENYDANNNIEMQVRYVILDKEPETEKSFNDLSADVINGILYSEYVNGCYSEWTCGYGGFDFLISDHSILQELSEHEGKYIYLQI